MSIFNRTSLMESINEIDVEPYEGYIKPTMESVAEINAELNEGVYKLTTSLYITDLLLEQRSQAGEDVEALMEAAVGDFFNKIIKKLKDMWAKIKAFFSNIFKKIKEVSSRGEKFINKYEKGIRIAANNKDAKWIEYNEYYDTDGIEDVIRITELTLRVNIMKELSSHTHDINKIKHNTGKIELTICEEISKAKTYDEAKSAVEKKIKGEKTGEKKKLDKADLLKILDRVKDYNNDGKSNIEKTAKGLDNLCKSAIGAVDYIKNNGIGRETYSGDDDNYNEKEVLTKYCAEISKAASFGNWLASYYVKAYNNQYANDLSVLKSFVSANSKLVSQSNRNSTKAEYVPPKEDAQTESSYSLLENILEAF